MTTKIAIWLGLFLLIALALDVWFFGTTHLIFLGKRLFELIDWIAFWR